MPHYPIINLIYKLLSLFLPKIVYPVQFLFNEIYFYFTGIKGPFNRGFALKWVMDCLSIKRKRRLGKIKPPLVENVELFKGCSMHIFTSIPPGKLSPNIPCCISPSVSSKMLCCGLFAAMCRPFYFTIFPTFTFKPILT